jgi:phage/plasmid primase-like uncharacterized protein
MERLIVEYQEGDGFTYSCTVTVPVVFRSKEEFLIALEDLVNEKLQKHKELQEKHSEAQEKFTKTLQKSLSDKNKETEQTSFQELLTLQSEAYLQMREATHLHIGGQTFGIENFLINLVDGGFVAPTVSTLDDFFSQVEKDALNS